jgi:tetratricopeptide (TPR) repeat protein
MAVLEEFPSELGTVLWQSLRTVRRWAAASPASRKKLFLRSAYDQRIADLREVTPDPVLGEPLLTIAELLKKGAEGSSGEVIGGACVQVAEWARTHRASATEFEFQQASASACPDDPKVALIVGRAARDRAEYPAAESWYQRAIALARRVSDWDTYARAYIGLGKTAVARGSYPTARKAFVKAVRVASRQRLRDPEGMALHDLFAVEAQGFHDAEALAYAAAALRAYGPRHRLLPSLALDLAYFWIERGDFAAALPVIQAVLPYLSPRHHLSAYGNMVRAAGAVGDELAFESSWQEVVAWADDDPHYGDALVATAQGAASLRRWDRAEWAAQRALDIGRKRREEETVHKAEALLHSVRNERIASARRGVPRLQVQGAARVDKGIAAGTETLARDLARSLAVGAPEQ